MSFKFSLLNLERLKDCDEPQEKMVKKKTKKQTVQRKKFGKAVQKCHAKTNGRKSFGSCMKKELKK